MNLAVMACLLELRVGAPPYMRRMRAAEQIGDTLISGVRQPAGIALPVRWWLGKRRLPHERRGPTSRVLDRVVSPFGVVDIGRVDLRSW